LTAMAPVSATPRPIAMTMGEPAGIGVEIAVKAWNRRGIYDLPPFYLIADPDHVREAAKAVAGIDNIAWSKKGAGGGHRERPPIAFNRPCRFSPNPWPKSPNPAS